MQRFKFIKAYKYSGESFLPNEMIAKMFDEMYATSEKYRKDVEEYVNTYPNRVYDNGRILFSYNDNLTPIKYLINNPLEFPDSFYNYLTKYEDQMDYKDNKRKKEIQLEFPELYKQYQELGGAKDISEFYDNGSYIDDYDEVRYIHEQDIKKIKREIKKLQDLQQTKNWDALKIFQEISKSVEKAINEDIGEYDEEMYFSFLGKSYELSRFGLQKLAEYFDNKPEWAWATEQVYNNLLADKGF